MNINWVGNLVGFEEVLLVTPPILDVVFTNPPCHPGTSSSSSSSDRLLSLYTTGGPPRPAWKQGRRRRGKKKKEKGRKKAIVSHRWRRGGTLSASCSTTTCTRRCRLFFSGPYQQLHSDTTFVSTLFLDISCQFLNLISLLQPWLDLPEEGSMRLSRMGLLHKKSSLGIKVRTSVTIHLNHAWDNTFIKKIVLQYPPLGLPDVA